MARKRDVVEEAFRRWVKLVPEGRQDFADMVAMQEANETMAEGDKHRLALRMRVVSIAASAERVRKPQIASGSKRGRLLGSKTRKVEGGGVPPETQVA